MDSGFSPEPVQKILAKTSPVRKIRINMAKTQSTPDDILEIDEELDENEVAVAYDRRPR
jgi:hypothetical protein